LLASHVKADFHRVGRFDRKFERTEPGLTHNAVGVAAVQP